MEKIKIGLLGDYNESVTAHVCIPKALAISAARVGCTIDPVWLPTSDLKNHQDAIHFDGIWCVPGSPYKNRPGVLEVIQYVRKSGMPYLGTCGGYQHAILEFAVSVLGLTKAGLEEEEPDTSMPLISALSCRLVDEARAIQISEKSKLRKYLGSSQLSEQYRCVYGMNPRYLHLFDESHLQFVGFNEEKVPQAFELSRHPFFIGTAFQPERSAMTGMEHPLISAFVDAASKFRSL